MTTYIISRQKSVLAPDPGVQPHPDSTNFRFLVGRGATSEGLNLRISMPAVFDEDLAFQIEDRSLWIFGARRKPEAFGDMRKFALRYGNFQQRIAIPAGLDAHRVIAWFHHGVLDIHIPFSSAAAASARPEVEAVEDSAAACPA